MSTTGWPIWIRATRPCSRAFSSSASNAKREARARNGVPAAMDGLGSAGGAGISGLQLAEPTDTAADLPAMFRSALDYLQKNKPGSAEIWVASDLQASNWHPESSEWSDIGARFAGLSQGALVRVLDLSSA